jgi:hypothetical protein
MTVLNRYRDHIPNDAVSIMRPSKWGNPFRIGARMTREQAIEAYRVDLWNRIRSGEINLEDLDNLSVVDLVCCCTPKPCHGHVLERAATWANDMLLRVK